MIFGQILLEKEDTNEYKLDTNSLDGGDDNNQETTSSDNDYKLDNNDETKDDSKENNDEDNNEYKLDNTETEDNMETTDTDEKDTQDDNEYSLDNNDESGDENLEEDPSEDNMDNATDDTGDVENELLEKEKELFAELTPEQLAIKTKELRSCFTELYSTVENTIEKSKNIQITEKNKEVLDFINKKLRETLTSIENYSYYTFETKTYFQNLKQYNFYILILKNVEKLFIEITDKN